MLGRLIFYFIDCFSILEIRMEAPSALDVDYVHRPDATRQEEPKPIMLSADYEMV
jgi:hypothetical protein